MKSSRGKFIAATIVLTALGIAAASIPPARAAIEAVMSCAKSTPCLEWQNTSSGEAVKGVSTNGNAVRGQTKFKSAGKNSGMAGILGEDLSTSGNLDAGVSGVSKNGAGVIGTSTNWNGMEGLTTGAGTSGVYGQNAAPNGFGIAGRNVGTTTDTSGAGVLADGGTNDDGLHAFSSVGVAGLFISHSGDFTPTLGVLAGTAGTGAIEVEIEAHDQSEVMGISDTGNVFIPGLLFTGGSCSNGCAVGNRQTHSVAEYTPAESEPTIEDFGNGMLTNGRADVALDPKFANVIISNAKYFVWAMPEGDCRGLYIANQTARGFTVRELQGGHASVPFEYRIDAKRFGVNAQRLPMSPIRRGLLPLGSRSL
jgi:hypothetical protein